MVFTYIIAGMASGALLAGLGLNAGIPLWLVILSFSLGGSLGILGLAGLICVLPRNATASADRIGSAATDGVKV